MLRNSNAFGPRGFTITELLISAGIWLFLVLAVVSAYVMLNQIWKEDLTLNELSRNANVAVEKMIRGSPLNTGLAAATAISAPAAGSAADDISYTDLSGTSRRFYYSTNSIYNISGAAIVSDVGSVTFTNVQDSIIIIDLKLFRYVGNKAIRFSISTQVSLKN